RGGYSGGEALRSRAAWIDPAERLRGLPRERSGVAGGAWADPARAGVDDYGVVHGGVCRPVGDRAAAAALYGELLWNRRFAGDPADVSEFSHSGLAVAARDSRAAAFARVSDSEAHAFCR